MTDLNPSRSGSKLVFSPVWQTDARIYGLVDGEFARLPASIRPLANERLLHLQTNTSGGRIRFITDSTCLGIHMQVSDANGEPHMPYTAYAGIDILLGEGPDTRYLATRVPPLNETVLHTEVALPGEPVLVTVYLPVYDGVKSFEIGVDDGASILSPPPYTREDPIVFYGSSITQGACASRPSNAYTALVSRWLNSNYISLGFNGSAKGELWLAEYIANLKMSCFVYDYDHNSPSPEYLLDTHRAFLETILNKQPDLPVVALSRPNPKLDGPDAQRREIVRATCVWAAGQGANIRFIDGNTLFGTEGQDCCTVDGVHPNDLGFWRMAKTVYPHIKAVLGG